MAGVGGGLSSRHREQGVESWGPNLTMNRNSIGRRSEGISRGFFCSRRPGSLAIILFSFTAELMHRFSPSIGVRATGTFLV